MLKITLENIDSIIPEYEKLFDKYFIDQAKVYTILGLEKCEVEKKEARAHPFFKLWKFLENDISNSKENKKLLFSYQSTFLLDLLSDLLSISEIKNKKRIIESLKDKSTFFSAAFEAYVCTLYLQYDIEIVQETSEKNPDFVIKTKEGTVQIECKSLLDRKTYEEDILSRLNERIVNILKKNKCSFFVYIKVDKDANIKKWEDIADKVNLLASSKTEKEYKDDKLKVHITTKKIKNWDVPFPSNKIKLNYPKDSPFIVDFETNLSNPIMQKNLIIVGAKKDLNLDFNTAIFSVFKKARKQVNKKHPSIIHIQIPIKNLGDYTSFTDRYYNEILKQFENDSKRVCGVVMSAALESDINIKRTESLVFPNYASSNTLPKDFRIPGTGNFNITEENQDNSRGTIQIPFIGKIPWDKIPEGILINICDRTGKSQFKLIKKTDNKCRIEIVGIGKKLFVLELENLNIQEEKSQILVFTWSEKEAFLSLDKEIIARKDLDNAILSTRAGHISI